MRTLFEATTFVSLALAAHLALWMPDRDMGVEASGSEGQSLLSITAASASVARMVETWDSPPEMSDAVEVEVALTDPDIAPTTSPARPQVETDRVARLERPVLDVMPPALPEQLPAFQDRAPGKMLEAPQLAALAPLAMPAAPDAPVQPAAPTQAPLVALPPSIALPSAPALPRYEPPASHDRPAVPAQPSESPTAPSTSKRPPKTVQRPSATPPSPDAGPASPTPPVATAQKARPKPEPAAKPAAKPAKKPPSNPSSGANAKVAEGTGGGVARGDKQKAKAATVSQARKNSMRAEGGGQIRARIARRAPRGVGRGTAVVTITVSGNGSLLGVRLAQSSGNSRIDTLALAAVKQAGRFPAAPKSLGIAKHTFRLPIKSK
ncbi:MAG: TonB family protein [Paracoccaceae bacterium]